MSRWHSYALHPPRIQIFDAVSFDGRRFIAERYARCDGFGNVISHVLSGAKSGERIAIWRAPECDEFGGPLCVCADCESARDRMQMALYREQKSALFDRIAVSEQQTAGERA